MLKWRDIANAITHSIQWTNSLQQSSIASLNSFHFTSCCAPRVSIYFNNSFIRCVRTHSFIIKIKFHSLLYVASFIPLNSFIPFRSLLSLPEWMVEMNYEINLIVGESGMRIATAITHFVSINDWIPLSPFATFIHFFSLRAVSIHFNFNSAPGVSARCINN